MASNYQHSEAFARMKAITERIPNNLTTHQYLATLDFLLESAIDPLVNAAPYLLDNFYAVVVAHQVNRASVKFTRTEKKKLPVLLFNALTTEGETKRAHQKAMLLNRGLLFGLIALFGRSVNSYRALHTASSMPRERRITLMRKVHRALGSTNLWAAIMQHDFWAAKAHVFKELITEKYTRLALLAAKRVYVELGHEVPLNDCIQVHLIYLNKAIDRCDSRLGVLTTFIQTWFYSARAELHRMIQHERTSISYDDVLHSAYAVNHEHGSHYETLQALACEAKRIDPDGAVRFQLGIPEFFTRAQLNKLRLFSTTTN